MRRLKQFAPVSDARSSLIDLASGGYLAFAFILLSLLSLSTGMSLVFTFLSLLVLTSIWRYLE